ncbi:hypothetical protein Goshw_023218, partial [Gossypium schwendimanii]|nr:hypothetical protein [Gossypium schwendimanii]
MAGLVAWDQTGVLLTTKIVLNSNVSSSFAAEAYAGLHAVKLGAIISDIQRQSEYFQEICFQFINKTENSLAHRIAKEALRREEETHLEGEALHCLQISPEAIKLKQMGQLDMKRRWKWSPAAVSESTRNYYL